LNNYKKGINSKTKNKKREQSKVPGIQKSKFKPSVSDKISIPL
jgi:hypothetical protein